MAESECGSSSSVFIRLKVSRQEIPASTRIFVQALATTAQLPRLPLDSMVTLTPMFADPRFADPCPQHTRPPCGFGSYFLVIQYLRAGFRLPHAGFRRLGAYRCPVAESPTPKADFTFPVANYRSPRASPIPHKLPQFQEETRETIHKPAPAKASS